MALPRLAACLSTSSLVQLLAKSGQLRLYLGHQEQAVSDTSLSPMAEITHYEIWKYYQSTSKVYANVLQNLVV